MNALVSILVPACNASAWVGDAIQSGLAQTWPNKEIIVVDDGSTDDTLARARQFECRGVKVVSQQNSGASAARNHALRLAQGEFIQWLDADDLLAVDKIELQMNRSGIQDNRRILSSAAWGRFFNSPERARFLPTSLWQDLTPAEWLLRKLDENLWMAVNCWLMSRELADAAGPWNPIMRRDNDGEYFCRVLNASCLVRFVPDARCYVRVGNATSISHMRNLSPEKLASIFQSLSLHIAYLRAMEDSERSRLACARLLQRWLVYFYPEHPDFVERMRNIAQGLGHPLDAPRLTWKYWLIQRIFGWRVAKRILFKGPKLQGLLARTQESLWSGTGGGP